MLGFSQAEPSSLAPRELSLRLLLAAAIFSVGTLVWTWLEDPFELAFQRTATVLLAPLTFGAGGHVGTERSLEPASSSHERDASWGTRLVLRIEGVQKTHAVAINPRRLLYLPLVCFGACLVAAPLSRRRRLWAIAVGVPLLTGFALFAVWVIAVWLFARVPGLVYDLAPWQRDVLRLAYEGWVTPLSNKFALPILIALAFTLWPSAAPKSAAVFARRPVSEGPAEAARAQSQPRDAKKRRARRARRRG